MIIKRDGQQVHDAAWQYKASNIYRIYQSAAVLYYLEKNKGDYALWGKFGYGTTTVGLFISLFFLLLHPEILAPEIVWTLQYYAYLVWYLYMSFRRFQYQNSENPVKILPKASTTGYPLRLISNLKGGLTEWEDTMFRRKYVNAHFSSMDNTVAEPLRTPVMVEGYPVIGAYTQADLEIAVNDDGSFSETLENVTYWLVLEDRIDLQVSAEFFRETVLNLQKTTFGDEYWVPVLSGLTASVIHGAIVDAINDFLKVSGMDTQSPEYLAALEQTLRSFETALSLMERDHPIHQHIA